MVCIHDGVLFSHKKNEIISFSGNWIGLEIIMLREISQTQLKKYHVSFISRIWT
jgi:hypothetical protein